MATRVREGTTATVQRKVRTCGEATPHSRHGVFCGRELYCAFTNKHGGFMQPQVHTFSSLVYLQRASVDAPRFSALPVQLCASLWGTTDGRYTPHQTNSRENTLQKPTAPRHALTGKPRCAPTVAARLRCLCSGEQKNGDEKTRDARLFDEARDHWYLRHRQVVVWDPTSRTTTCQTIESYGRVSGDRPVALDFTRLTHA